jgi:hypothetical protein
MQVTEINELPTAKRTRRGKYSETLKHALNGNIRVECADEKEAQGLWNAANPKRFGGLRIRESKTVVCLGPTRPLPPAA